MRSFQDPKNIIPETGMTSVFYSYSHQEHVHVHVIIMLRYSVAYIIVVNESILNTLMYTKNFFLSWNNLLHISFGSSYFHVRHD